MPRDPVTSPDCTPVTMGTFLAEAITAGAPLSVATNERRRIRGSMLIFSIDEDGPADRTPVKALQLATPHRLIQ